MIQQRTIGISLVGCGQRGLNCHAKTFLEQGGEGVELLGLCDTNPENLEQAHRRYPDAKYVSTDYRDVIDHDDVDAVIVASTNMEHRDQAVFAFEKDKHVFCEKPLHATLQGCYDILDAADRSGNVLEVGFVLRYAPTFAKVKELIGSGEIGTPLNFHWTVHYAGGIHYFRTWHRFRKFSGGLTVEKSCHDFDLLTWFLRQYPERVTMWASLNKFIPGTKPGEDCMTCPEPCEDRNTTVRGGVTMATPDGTGPETASPIACYYNTPKDIPDTYVAIMDYPSGLKGTFNMCFYNSAPYYRRFDIVGSKGEIVGNIHDSRVELHKRDKNIPPEVFDLSSLSTGGHHGGDWRQVKRFLDSIRTGEPNLVRGIDGLRAVAISEAMNRSLDEERVVKLEELIGEEWLKGLR